MYADDLILVSATVNELQTMLNCRYNVSVNLLLKFDCAKSSCFAIGKGRGFNISNMQLADDYISWSSSFKFLSVSFIAGKKLSVDIDVVRRIFSACNCILGNTKYQSEILKLTLQESYTLPLLQHDAMALRFTKPQLDDLNVCWNVGIWFIARYLASINLTMSDVT